MSSDVHLVVTASKEFGLVCDLGHVVTHHLVCLACEHVAERSGGVRFTDPMLMVLFDNV